MKLSSNNNKPKALIYMVFSFNFSTSHLTTHFLQLSQGHIPIPNDRTHSLCYSFFNGLVKPSASICVPLICLSLISPR
ncbi:hypothetical protein GGR54DRAFT_414894 [Hypoxylon sp. NC1633]|nr:hypothetical protein GGR54DRAFT_414894 [Hypoxylon sp. NC1633]